LRSKGWEDDSESQGMRPAIIAFPVARNLAFLASVSGGLPSAPGLIAQTPSSFTLPPPESDSALSLPRTFVDCSQAAAGDEILVCGQQRRISPYRLPPAQWDPAGPVQSVSRERHSLYELGETGIQSCSPAGPGGWTGCTQRRWKEAREQYGR
jgi:hypothetical protein